MFFKCSLNWSFLKDSEVALEDSGFCCWTMMTVCFQIILTFHQQVTEKEEEAPLIHYSVWTYSSVQVQILFQAQILVQESLVSAAGP